VEYVLNEGNQVPVVLSIGRNVLGARGQGEKGKMM